jgi:3-hydroxyisobutyrate dehydrogenase-like beta-hydroxyacid dehydrogenase
MRVAVLGLGEAGSMIGSDLARAGDEVRGYDPARVPTPLGVKRHARPHTAADRCELVSAVTPGSQARAALGGVLDALEDQVVDADLSTGSPGLKGEVAAVIAGRGARFADVALMSPIPGHGLTAPALVSGSGAQQFADVINARRGNVEVASYRSGDARHLARVEAADLGSSDARLPQPETLDLARGGAGEVVDVFDDMGVLVSL